MRNSATTILLVAILCTQGCTTTPPVSTDSLMGSWKTTVGGFTMVATFGKSEVSLDDHAPVNFTLDGNILTVDGDITSRRIVRFESIDKMIQVDLISGTEQRFDRIREGGQ